MPWYHNIVPETIKKRVCAYLLQRYLGQFFEEKVTRDQLSVDLYNGTGTVEKISLDVQALNELGEKQNLPMEFVDGYIDKLFITIPWTSILKDTCFIEVTGLKLTVQPKQRSESATSMIESMWNSMTSSMQLAQECAKQDTESSTQNAQPYEGLELFAQTIDSILSRVKVKFIDTTIQIEHVPKDSSTGVGVTINLDLIEYSDEAGNDPTHDEATELTNQDAKKAYLVQSFTIKRFNIQGVSLSTLEFTSKARTFSRSVASQSPSFEKDKMFVGLMENTHIDDDDFQSFIENNGSNKSTQAESESQSELSSDKQNVIEDNNKHVVLFGKICNKQEIRICLKQSENVNGPKVSFEVNLGSLILFLSPRQVHVLTELANGFASPDIEDTSNVAPRAKCAEKPMSGVDYQRVEQELQNQLHPLSTFAPPGLRGAHGWSTAALDESDTDENFLPMKNAGSGMYDSTLSGISSSMDSSLSSSMASSLTEQTNRSRRRASQIDSDPTAEISHFQIRIASVATVLLHEDVLLQSTEYEQILVPCSVSQIQKMSVNFFNSVGNFALTATKDFDNAKVAFEKAVKVNHIRILAAPVHIEGNEKTTLTAFSLGGRLTAAKLELLECLYKTTDCSVEYVPLLTFNNVAPLQNESPLTAKPSLRLNFIHVEKTSKSGPSRSVGPKTDVTFLLNNCTVDFDISIIDRICALLNPHPICVIDETHQNPWAANASSFNSNTPESRLDLKISSPSINLKLRFPIPDFRPSHDMSRLPWWNRHVRPDYLSLIFSDVTIQTTFQASQTFKEYVIQSRGLDIIYYESENSAAVPVAKAGFDDKYATSMQDVLLHSRFTIKVYPVKRVDLEECDKPIDPMIHSVYGAFEDQHNRSPGPFSAKRVVHESDTPHGKLQKDVAEELIIPGEKHEIDDFIKSTSMCSRFHVDVFLPKLSMQLISKHIYELIYNRINNDLLLWEPSAPKPKPNVPNFYNTNYGAFRNINADIQENFKMCKSGIVYESGSDTGEESEEDTINIFYSTYDTHTKSLLKQQNALLSYNKSNCQSYLVFNLQINHGLLCMFTPVRDVASNNVIPGQHGEFLLNVDNANIFLVSGYKGDDNLGYACVQVHNAQLHHCEMASTPSPPPPLKEIGTAVGRHLHPTIYKSDKGMLANSHNRGGNRELLTVAIKIQANHETHHVKTVRVALALNKATLRHKMCIEPNSWISHLLDFFNVQDYPTTGYHAKDVLTELHLHMWDCAIDYRPANLPYRSAVTFGNFSISSHLTAQSNSSTLRFIAEECGLFLSDKAPPRNRVPSTAPVDLKRDYVNVVQIGLFEVSLKTTDKKSGANPHIDLRASNDRVDIHTCSDSGRALMQLITYFANNGDLESAETVTNSASTSSSPRHQPDQELVKIEPQEINDLTKSQYQRVNDLIGEAMIESSLGHTDEMSFSSDHFREPAADLFFFPDENQPDQEHTGKPLPQVTHELGDVAYYTNLNCDIDDDFCFVGDEAGLGIFPKNGQPEIKWLTNDPVRVIDAHFAIPIKKTDLLKSPKHFPTPVLRYTLREMTIVWHMYGGNDFGEKDSENKKKTVNFSDMQLKDCVSFSNTPQGGIVKTSSASNIKEDISWLVRAGVNRNHNVLMELQLNKILENLEKAEIAYEHTRGQFLRNYDPFNTSTDYQFIKHFRLSKELTALAHLIEMLDAFLMPPSRISLIDKTIKVRFQHEIYPETAPQASRQVLIISEVEVRDRLETSQINKFLYQHISEARPKQSQGHMVVIKAVHIRPDPKLKSQECCLKVSLLPLRLNIDQDSLLFLINFFSELGGSNGTKDGSCPHTDGMPTKNSQASHVPPVMTISPDNTEVLKERAQKMVDENLLILLEESKFEEESPSDVSASSTSVDDSHNPPIYFRNVVFSPEVPIRLDYHGKRVDMSHGSLPGLLMGLGQLNCSELKLKRISHRHGLLGFDKLMSYLLQEWLNDIKKNQLPSLLGGVGPMHSLVQLFQGVRDLFWLPIEQYQKDGRIVRGLQRGANSFTTSTAMAALELTSRIIHLIQVTAETAYDMLSPGPSVRRVGKTKGRRRRYHQPLDIREGMTNAIMLVKEGIGETADNIVQVASHEHEQKGYSGAVGGVLRQIPPTILKPIIIASEATTNVLGGMRCQLVPDARREANQKWRKDDV